jgi:two-component system response regulator QseB
MRVLVIEDDRPLGEALAEGLRQLGHAVDWFTTGTEADSALGVAPYDAIVLDLGLPQRDGLSWLTEWRRRAIHVPVMVLTARDAVEQRIEGLDAGADDYLVKPITIDELAARLRALVRRASGARTQSVWQHGALSFNAAARTVAWQGQPADLTAREMAVLEVLMLHPHRVLSKAALLEKLYDWSRSEPDANSLEVHIHHLRRKLDPCVVRTVRGVGYALGACEPSSTTRAER